MAPADGNRRRWVIAASALLAGCATAVPPRLTFDGRWLVPLRGLLGARLVRKTDIGGNPTPDGYGNYQPFMFPVAVAATALDIYIADAGLGRILRYDRMLDVMTVMPGTANRGTRLQTGPDGSVYVLDAATSSISRLTRGGQALPPLTPQLPTTRYREFAIDPRTGRAYAIDANHFRLDRIEPLGRIAVSEFDLAQGSAVAAGDRSVYVADAACRCINEWRDGQLLRRFAPGELRQPIAIAVERQTLVALDAFDRSLCLVHQGGVDRLAAHQLGLVTPEAIALLDGQLIVADGAGHSVAIFRVAPRP